MEKEIRIAEIRASLDSDQKPIIEGHAAVFNQPSLEIFQGWPGWREVIRPNAFSEAIRAATDCCALINHDDNHVIGRISNRTLTMEEDEIGLKVRIFPPDTQDAHDLLTRIRGRYISQMSFGFTVADDGQVIDRENKLRSITKIKKLYDVSPVTQPAYPQTDVSLRSLFAVESKPDFDFSKAVRDFIARRTFKPDQYDYVDVLQKCRLQKPQK